MCDLVVDAWNKLSNEMIKKSFLVCGQAKNSKPEDITCLKEGHLVHEALEAVKALWNEPLEELVSSPTPIESDDEDELGKNEVLIEDE